MGTFVYCAVYHKFFSSIEITLYKIVYHIVLSVPRVQCDGN